MSERQATVTRETAETSIVVRLDLDGAGDARIETGIGFFDHMLTQTAVHGLFDLEVEAHGDLEVDAHHTVEDVGLALGGAVARALGDRVGIRRYGAAVIALDDALVRVVVDLSGRTGCYAKLTLDGAIGSFDGQLVKEFLVALCRGGALTLHADTLAGENRHHIAEAAFKALGRALDEATGVDPRRARIPSSKGRLT